MMVDNLLGESAMCLPVARTAHIGRWGSGGSVNIIAIRTERPQACSKYFRLERCDRQNRSKRAVTRRAAQNTKGVSDFLCAAARPFVDQPHHTPQFAVQTNVKESWNRVSREEESRRMVTLVVPGPGSRIRPACRLGLRTLRLHEIQGHRAYEQ